MEHGLMRFELKSVLYCVNGVMYTLQTVYPVLRRNLNTSLRFTLVYRAAKSKVGRRA